MPHPANQKCENCLYYVPFTEPDPDWPSHSGMCRRNAPVLLVDGDGMRWTGFPPINLNMWCGEWAPAPVNNGEQS